MADSLTPEQVEALVKQGKIDSELGRKLLARMAAETAGRAPSRAAPDMPPALPVGYSGIPPSDYAPGEIDYSVMNIPAEKVYSPEEHARFERLKNMSAGDILDAIGAKGSKWYQIGDKYPGPPQGEKLNVKVGGGEKPPADKPEGKPKGGGFAGRIKKQLDGIAGKYGDETKKYHSRLQDRLNRLADIEATESLAKWTQGLRHEREMGEFEQRQLDIQKAAATATEGKLKSLQGAIENYRSAKVDPGRLVRDNKGMSALALALGALGQAFHLTQGRQNAKNMGLVAINQAVERDIQAQQAEIDKLGTEIDIAGNDLRLTMQLFDRKEQQVAAARVLSIEKYQRALGYLAQQWGGEKALIQNEIAQEQLEHQKRLEMRKLAVDEFKLNLDAEKVKQGWARIGMAKKAMQAKAQAGVPMDKKESQELGGYYEMTKLVGEMARQHKQLRDKLGSSFNYISSRMPFSTAAKRYNLEWTIPTQAIARLIESGRMSDADRDFYQDNRPLSDDTIATAESKTRGLLRYFSTKYEGIKRGMEMRGVNVSGVPSLPGSTEGLPLVQED